MVVEQHIEGATRVSVAVVEGSEGPVALLPSQEEVVCPEIDFLDAHIAAQRKMAQTEVPPARKSMPPVLLHKISCAHVCEVNSKMRRARFRAEAVQPQKTIERCCMTFLRQCWLGFDCCSRDLALQ